VFILDIYDKYSFTYNRGKTVSLDIDRLHHVGRGLGSKGLLGLGGQALGAAIQAECRSGSGKQDKGKRESHGDFDY
jgi:hypothetical protein